MDSFQDHLKKYPLAANGIYLFRMYSFYQALIALRPDDRRERVGEFIRLAVGWYAEERPRHAFSNWLMKKVVAPSLGDDTGDGPSVEPGRMLAVIAAVSSYQGPVPTTYDVGPGAWWLSQAEQDRELHSESGQGTRPPEPSQPPLPAFDPVQRGRSAQQPQSRPSTRAPVSANPAMSSTDGARGPPATPAETAADTTAPPEREGRSKSRGPTPREPTKGRSRSKGRRNVSKKTVDSADEQDVVAAPAKPKEKRSRAARVGDGNPRPMSQKLQNILQEAREKLQAVAGPQPTTMQTIWSLPEAWGLHRDHQAHEVPCETCAKREHVCFRGVTGQCITCASTGLKCSINENQLYEPLHIGWIPTPERQGQAWLGLIERGHYPAHKSLPAVVKVPRPLATYKDYQETAIGPATVPPVFFKANKTKGASGAPNETPRSTTSTLPGAPPVQSHPAVSPNPAPQALQQSAPPANVQATTPTARNKGKGKAKSVERRRELSPAPVKI